ncbi:MAG TPA: efflux RND transporter periplasmic adaptor subunit [Gemmatimonadaceae bacterium]|nr:efflux RND transporter periplasmic adaptor subunit [Gemmatimonadaceae bacterium]
MKKTRITAIATAIVLLAGGVWLYRRADAREVPAYRFATVERGSIQSTVSATGTLSAIRTVDVGTQVSGQIAAIYVDFNDRVKKGQLLARIDPTLAQQAVQDAQAGLDRARAQYELAKEEYDRNKQLFEQKIITASEFATSESNYRVSQTNVTSAQVALDRARKNLGYTSIYAPIDGVIVERNVDVGQTVAASLQTPTLFLIANDLSRMQILASVDESDIGAIHDGQPVRFTVQAYPNQPFDGTVQQVRLQSKTQDNVVSYTVVVEVENPKGLLLPGMTATVDFLTGSAADVLMVPNAALRFRPTGEMLAAAGRGESTGRAASGANGTRSRGDSARARRADGLGGAGAMSGAGSRPRSGSVGTLWYVGADGKPAMMRVRTGLSDGQRTQVQGQALREGMQVIVGTNQPAQGSQGAQGAGATNPLQPRMGPPRRGGF